MIAPLRVFIGFDPREAVAFHVLAHSILTRASSPVAIIPLVQSQLRSAGVYTRERGPTESTEFSLTRFLVPYLAGYQGLAVFLDCDILCRCDLPAEVCTAVVQGRARAQWDGREAPALWCVQHDYTPTEGVKFLGNPQTVYPRKNWSSVMVFDADRCRALTPEYVNAASGLQLHRFQWCPDERIATLPVDLNWLVGEYEPNPTARMLHYTLGGPYFAETRDCDHADLWRLEQGAMMSAAVRESVAA